jgi:hypothetical protein
MPSDLRDSQGKKVKDLLWQERVYKDLSGYKEMKHLYRLLDQLIRLPSSKQGEHHIGRGGSSQQFCIVKARIGRTAEGHRKFLIEYLPQKNKERVKEKPRIFGEAGVEDPLRRYREHMTGKHFKFHISPDSQRVDTEALVRTLVKRMEAVTGRQFYWVAACHTDTAHKHAHLLMNGVDKNGKDIYFDPSFIKGTIREMTREICTAMIGSRTGEQIRQQKENIHKAIRYTYVDEDLKNFERPYDGQDTRFESRIESSEETHYKRLTFLASLDLAQQDGESRNCFYLEKSWKHKLKSLGRYNSYLRARQELQYTLPCNLEEYCAETGPIEGQITRLYKMNDEDSWNHAMVVENKELGKAWYVPLWYEPRDVLAGSTVRLRAKKNERGQMRPVIYVLQEGT